MFNISLSDRIRKKGDQKMFKVRLKKLRKEYGISQYKLAADIHSAQSTIAGWESGAREPDFEMAKKIADYFEVSTDYLLGNTDDPTPPDAKKEALTGKSGELWEFLKRELGREPTDADVQVLKDVAKLLPKEIEKQGK